jgi:uncharacterized protein YggE
MTMRHALSIIAVALSCALASPAFAVDKTITVTGEATTAVMPDQAMIRIGVMSQGKTAREATDANAKQMNAVIGAIRNAGVEDRDIQTARLSLQPQFEQTKTGANKLTGYSASNDVNVRLREIDKLPGVLDSAVSAGANEISGIDFTVSDASKRLDDTRAAAVADARRKAEIYAKAAGLTVGRALTISEEGAPIGRPVPMLRAATKATPVAPGEQTLQAAVTITYELVQ